MCSRLVWFFWRRRPIFLVNGAAVNAYMCPALENNGHVHGKYRGPRYASKTYALVCPFLASVVPHCLLLYSRNCPCGIPRNDDPGKRALP